MKLIELGKSAKIISGFAFKSESFTDNGIPVIKISNIGLGDMRIEESNTQYVESDYLDKLDEKFKVSFGDVLISLTGSHITQPNSVVGRVSLYKESYISLLNQRAGKVINIDKKVFDKRFLFYILNSASVRTTIALMAHGAASQANVSPKDVERIKLLVPTVENQKKIAAILSAYDDLIENNKKRIQILEDMTEELYKEWFVRFRFPNFENTEFEKGVPKGWSYSTLESLGKIRTGKTPSTSNSEFYGGEYPFYKTPDMHDKVFVFETAETLTEQGLNSQKSQIIEANEIMVTCIGSGGVTAISTKKGCTNQQINSLSVANKKFLYWAYYSIKYLKPQIELYGATGATMTNLSKGKFSNLEIIKPTDVLIEQYFNLVSPKFEMIKKLSQMSQMLEEQKHSLLPRLISGKLSVENLDIQFPTSMQEL